MILLVRRPPHGELAQPFVHTQTLGHSEEQLPHLGEGSRD